MDQAISLQERAGLPVVTDGEMRRESFQSQMVEAVEGFGEHTIDAWLWGDWHGDETVGDKKIERPGRSAWSAAAPQALPLGRGVRLRPSPHGAHDQGDAPEPQPLRQPLVAGALRGGLPTLDDFLDDVAEILRDEVEELVRLGATYIQLDAPHYPLLLDPSTREFYEGRGWDFDRWMSRGVELDNYVIGEHPGVTFAFHLCRGNQGSRWLVSGSYEPLARGSSRVCAPGG